MSTSNLYCISITLLSMVLLVLCVILFCFLRHSGKIEVNVSKDKSATRKNVFPFLFSTMSLVTSFIAIAMILPNRNAEMNFNYFDVIVGILSLLITILLGWQIYNGIKFEEHSQYVSETRNNIENEKLEIEKLTKETTENLQNLKKVIASKEEEIATALCEQGGQLKQMKREMVHIKNDDN